MKAGARSRVESSFENSCAIALGPPQRRAAIWGEKEKLPRHSQVVNQVPKGYKTFMKTEFAL
jgi:hypothetical protein